MTDLGDPPPPAVAVERLTKRYGDTVAVADLTFSIRAGTITGFLGPNGAGKTTTFRILCGLAAPTSGTAHLLGRPYAALDEPPRRVGALLDVAGYHPTRTARNHLRVVCRAAGLGEGDIDGLLSLVGLEGAADRRVGGFSSGMRQRLGLAVALLGDPDILLLDEPANGLDPRGIRWLRHFLRSMAQKRGKTVLVSSHVLAEVAQMVDDVVIINRGRLVSHGPVGAVMEDVGASVVVRSPHRERLADLLEARDGVKVMLEDGRLVVAGLGVEAVGELAATHGVVLHELREEGSSLEQAFLSLTGEGTGS